MFFKPPECLTFDRLFFAETKRFPITPTRSERTKLFSVHRRDFYINTEQSWNVSTVTDNEKQYHLEQLYVLAIT